MVVRQLKTWPETNAFLLCLESCEIGIVIYLYAKNEQAKDDIFSHKRV